MLSNCPECSFYHSKGCAVQPHYWEMRVSISRLSSFMLGMILPWLCPCPDWRFNEELPPDTFPQTINISGVEFDL